MIKRLLTSLRGLFNITYICLHTIFWCTPMYVFLILKSFSKHPAWRKWNNARLVWLSKHWIKSNNLWMDATMKIEWDLPDLSDLKLDDWYFIICNHQSWSDILILFRTFVDKIPFIRFFIKKELMWLPVLNGAWWAYDFPIMHRHTKEQIAKNPALREKDLLATKRACQIYQTYPVTILNFLEGTRYTPQKHQLTQSPFKHLLPPRAGGFAYAVTSMESKIRHVLDVTIIYPDGKKSFWDLLCGRIPKIILKVKQRELPDTLLEGNYADPACREAFKSWVFEIWSEKDTLISSIL